MLIKAFYLFCITNESINQSHSHPNLDPTTIIIIVIVVILIAIQLIYCSLPPHSITFFFFVFPFFFPESKTVTYFSPNYFILLQTMRVNDTRISQCVLVDRKERKALDLRYEISVSVYLRPLFLEASDALFYFPFNCFVRIVYFSQLKRMTVDAN